MQPASTIQLPQELYAYLSELLGKSGFVLTDRKFRNYALTEIYLRLMDYINLHIITRIPEEKQTAFGNLLDSQASQEQIDRFVAETVPDIKEVYGQLLAEFSELYLRSEGN